MSRGAVATRSVPAAPSGTRELLKRALAEDRVDRDVTTRALFPTPQRVRARVVAQSTCVVAGLGAAVELGRLTAVRVRPLVAEGANARRGTPVLELEGDLRTILGIERTLLNLVMHLSGVATATRRAVDRARVSAAPRVYATRKTLPGLRALEKAAVRSGGGQPHRSDLADAVLVKTNHLAFRDVRSAVARLRSALPGRPIEVEVGSVADARAAVDAGADAILIDNAPPGRARRMAERVRAMSGRRRIWIEVSGGINLETLHRYRRVGADAASLGSITHSAPAVPFHLRFARPGPRAGPVASASRRR